MSYKQLLDDAIGVAPVSTVDVDRVIARQRRTALARTVTASAAGVVVVTTGVALAFANGSGGPPSPAPVGGQTTVAAPSTRQRPVETSAQVARRLSDGLKARLGAVAPDAGYEVDPAMGGTDMQGLFAPSEALDKPTDLSHHYLSQVLVTRHGVTSLLHTNVYLVRSGPTPSPSTSDAPWEPTSCATFWPAGTAAKAKPGSLTCEERGGPDGAQVLVGMQKAAGQVSYRVVVNYADGSRVDSDVVTPESVHDSTLLPVLSKDELAELFADPSMAP